MRDFLRVFIYSYIYIQICVYLAVLFLVFSWENKFNVSSAVVFFGGNWGDSLFC